jgi:hypothetical protein
LCPAWKNPGRTLGCTKEAIEFIKGKGKASQNAVVAPSGQVGQMYWKCILEKKKNERGSSLFQGLLKLPVICLDGEIFWLR